MSPTLSMETIQLFLDLDGVLVDFDAGVQKATGHLPGDLTLRKMWSSLARSNQFFAHLSWTHDGYNLWQATQVFNPIILTGLPHGSWADPQKRAWCARELGEDIPVITCMSRDKAKEASLAITKGATPILIDDRPHYKDLWCDMGGIFITHTSTKESLEHLRALNIRGYVYSE
jgi:hypothetical protein